MVWFQKVSLLLGLLLVLSLVGSPSKAQVERHKHVCPKAETFSKAMFPKGFLWGTSTGAFQVEGGVDEGCKGPSLWDTFTKKYPEKCQNSNADVAVDFYHRYKEDIQLMKDLNTNGFRFSIAWTRIFPHGRMSKGISQEGVQFYHDLIDELLKNNITPLVTVFHWDTPQDLEDEYGGFLSNKIVKDFTEYANFTFHKYGDKVKNWVTLNEPLSYSRGGYEIGRLAPGHCSPYIPAFGPNCVGGRSGFEAYLVTHNLLLSHADAVEAFRKCKKCVGGKIGIAHSPSWFEPYDVKTTHHTIKRALDFDLGWHLHPTTYGDYPESMKRNVGFRLPNFTEPQKAKLRNSADFVGINYYTSQFAKNNPNQDFKYPSWQSDSQVDWNSRNVHGLEIGFKPTNAIMNVYAKGLRKILNYVKEEYGDPEIMILENGYGENLGEDDSVEVGTNDYNRQDYLERHLWSLHEAICFDKVHVTGYFAWSLMDNFEWIAAYKARYGLYYIDYKNNLTRHQKLSGKWYSDFLNPIIPTSAISREEL